MADAAATDFINRVLEKLNAMPTDKFSSESWRFEGRPTSEGVGLKPGVSLDVDTVVSRILDIDAYPANVKYVESTELTKPVSDTEFTYIQKMKLPALGGMQVALHIQDLGEIDGWRVVAWDQDDEGTQALNPKDGGARTEYNLGAWLIKSDALAYALSAAPVKKDVGSIKYAVMTKGAEATVGTVLSANIDSMEAWASR